MWHSYLSFLLLIFSSLCIKLIVDHNIFLVLSVPVFCAFLSTQVFICLSNSSLLFAAYTKCHCWKGSLCLSTAASLLGISHPLACAPPFPRSSPNLPLKEFCMSFNKSLLVMEPLLWPLLLLAGSDLYSLLHSLIFSGLWKYAALK